MASSNPITEEICPGGKGRITQLLSARFPNSHYAQTVAFDLVISGELPVSEFVPCFVHGRADVLPERRQAVFIDVERRALYAAIWHAGLQREVTLSSKAGLIDGPCRLSIVFAVSTILGAYSLFVDGSLAAEFVEQPGDVAGGLLVSTDFYEIVREPGLEIANLRCFGEYSTPALLDGASHEAGRELIAHGGDESHFSCIDLEKQVNLSWYGGKENLTFCCFTHNKRGLDVGFLPILGAEIKDSRLPLAKIAEERRRVKDIINKGEEESVCHGCPRLQKAVWPVNQENRFITITVNSWTACNLRCEYCFTIDTGTPFIAKPSYDLLTMFRDLSEQGKFEAGASVGWGGGDVTVLQGFEEASAFLTEAGVAQLVNTNAITFSPAIAGGLARGLMDVQVSVDAGTRELYEAIKGRDHLDAVWRNLTRYHKIAQDAPRQGKTRLPYPIVAKYIIYHNNCEDSEILEFVRRCRQHGMRFLTISAKQGELLPNGRNGHLSLRPDDPADSEERILRGVALMRREAMSSQIGTTLWTFSPAQERLIERYEYDIAVRD